VTTDEGDDVSPALSPDGSRIAFLSTRDDPDPAGCEHDCFYQLFVIGVDGTGERKVVDTEVSPHHPDWHPSGTQIIFDTENNLQGDTYVVNDDGSGLQVLIEGGFWADWSPDGRQIVFASRRDGQIELYIADADGGNQRQLTDNDLFEYFPDWSPDGKRIAFAVLQEKAIHVMAIDGGTDRRLALPGNAENPAWSPDGTRIAYQSSNDGDFEIYVVDVEPALQGEAGVQPVQLTHNEIGDFWPSWGRRKKVDE
jgi:Tol biopolymer transport system component